MTRAVEEAVAAIRNGEAVVLATDTVYGLAASAYAEGPALRLYALKERPRSTPCALLGADLDAILDAVPELRGRAAIAARALLPGPYTLVLPNPSTRFRWLCGENPQAIGIRVPELPPLARQVVERVGVVASTSANLHGEPDLRRTSEISPKLGEKVAVILDEGLLPGTPSTVLDLTGASPRVVREGAGSVASALDLLVTA